MKKEITVGQLLSVAVTLLIAVITGWVTMSKKVTEQETKFSIQIEQIKKEQDAIQGRFDRFTERTELKLDKINENVNSVLVKMESKIDRQ
jgi:predicted negative regulator of RcsB-dependent stress response